MASFFFAWCESPPAAAAAARRRNSWIPELFRQPMNDRVVTASPMYQCYVNRLLPGVIERLPPEEHCINATVWENSSSSSSSDDEEDYLDDNDIPTYTTERARIHPGDRGGDNENIGSRCSSSEDKNKYSEDDYFSITTKAGSRLWSISFATNETDCNDIEASFPGQLTQHFCLLDLSKV